MRLNGVAVKIAGEQKRLPATFLRDKAAESL
jgi:hypothetical protein